MKVPTQTWVSGIGLQAITRQPIFRPELDVYGYELFFPPVLSESGDTLLDVSETSLTEMVGSRRAFINLTRDFILSGLCWAFPARQVVLEVLEDVPPDRDVVRELGRLNRAGYQVALDDFVFAAGYAPLVELADIVKIDLLTMNRTEVRRLVRALEPHRVRLVAEKIETSQDLAFALDLGFDLLQGFFLSRPDRVA